MSKAKAILFGPLPPPFGGVAVFMASIKEACIARGVQVWSYAGDDGDDRVVRVNHRSLGHIRRLLAQPNRVRITDSTHFHLEYPHWLLSPLWLFAKKLKRFTWIKICHDGSLPSRFDEMHESERRRVRKAAANIDELVVYSRQLEKWFRDELSYRGVLRFISLLTPQPSSRLARPGVRVNTGQAFVVTSIGAFIPSYGFHDVAAAVERLRKGGREVTLVLLDGAFARDETYKSDVMRGRRWIEVHEGVPHDEISGLLARSDVFIRPFAHESYGLSRVEAILAGTPVIATNMGETRGMLTYEFGDVHSLTELLRSVLYDHAGLGLDHWQEIYRREAEENLAAYIRLVTGENDAPKL